MMLINPYMLFLSPPLAILLPRAATESTVRLNAFCKALPTWPVHGHTGHRQILPLCCLRHLHATATAVEKHMYTT